MNFQEAKEKYERILQGNYNSTTNRYSYPEPNILCYFIAPEDKKEFYEYLFLFQESELPTTNQLLGPYSFIYDSQTRNSKYENLEVYVLRNEYWSILVEHRDDDNPNTIYEFPREIAQDII